ncbi:MAG: carboxypeptidase regulatory-like domain-containing protein [Candidatus Kapaibacterium sp.]|nr:carboxypeptidase-like regulatory domain-containing protein [Bacteroidota bacterium]
MKVTSFFLLAVLFISLNSGCNDTVVTIPHGRVQGLVNLKDSLGVLLNSHSDVNITFQGNSTISSTTDSSGKYLIEKLDAGIYTVVFSKEGFVNYTVENFQFVGNGTYTMQNVILRQMRKSDTQEIAKNKWLTGSIRLIDMDGNDIQDKSGVRVSIKGTSFFTTSNSDGTYNFKTFPKGSHSLLFQCSGFDDLEVENVYLPDSTTLQSTFTLTLNGYTTIILTQKPNLNVVSSGINFWDGSYTQDTCVIYHHQNGSLDTITYLSISGKVTPEAYGKQVGILMVYSTSENVSINNHEFYQFIGPVYNPKREFYKSYGFSTYEPGDQRVVSRWHIQNAGKKVYVAAYAYWYNGKPQQFVNKLNGQVFIHGLSAPSNIISRNIPSAYKLMN